MEPETHLLHVGIKGYEAAGARPAGQPGVPGRRLRLDQDAGQAAAAEGRVPRCSPEQLPQRTASASIVVYAGGRPGAGADRRRSNKGPSVDALDRLQAGGSTNGGEGIALAYAMAKQAFMKAASTA